MGLPPKSQVAVTVRRGQRRKREEGRGSLLPQPRQSRHLLRLHSSSSIAADPLGGAQGWHSTCLGSAGLRGLLVRQHRPGRWPRAALWPLLITTTLEVTSARHTGALRSRSVGRVLHRAFRRLCALPGGVGSMAEELGGRTSSWAVPWPRPAAVWGKSGLYTWRGDRVRPQG